MAGSDEAKASAKTTKKKAQKPKKPMSHPKYSEMIKDAVTQLKERGGSSRQAIHKFIIANYNVGKDSRTVGSHLKMALRAGVRSGTLKQCKGTGASGSFKLGLSKPETVKSKKTVVKKPKAKSPKAKKLKSPKKVAEKKEKKPTKKAAKPKKSQKTKTAKPKPTKAKAKKTQKKSTKKK